jgi:hypothetical protein
MMVGLLGRAAGLSVEQVIARHAVERLDDAASLKSSRLVAGSIPDPRGRRARLRGILDDTETPTESEPGVLRNSCAIFAGRFPLAEAIGSSFVIRSAPTWRL